MTGTGDERRRAGLREAIYWLTLLAAVVLLVVAISGDYLGECSSETGYEPELGFMQAVPVALVVVGLTEAMVAVASGWPRRVAVRLGLVGVGVTVLAFVSFVTASASASIHSCD